MTDLLHQRCFNHAGREAAARCPACKRFFCRECVTEHDDRVICAACLRALGGAGTATGRARLRGPALALRAILGVFVLWVIFYQFGMMLLKLPSSFHEGTLWSPDIGSYLDEE